MGRPEYSGCVYGVVFGVLLTRSTSRSSAILANSNEVSVLRARLAAQEAAQEDRDQENNARFAGQEARLARMQALIKSLMPNRWAMGGRLGKAATWRSWAWLICVGNGRLNKYREWLEVFCV